MARAERGGARELFARLEGRACTYCDGDLVRERYKGDRAVVCVECGTPAARAL
ncbi:HVO_A0556 family zinc finger protein [Saliphagus sp. LR7]|uniref:HVO_A0556 family zinc finger protein n=1 Tax=Saliphagus sp. LR7 TaxID=2282654 RepID=UPI0018E50D62|nr:HVO_A0556 family zinc finger protein [Saliphagus sp. LR7]